MDALQIANFLKEAGPWAVSTVLLVILTLFVRGDIIPSKVVENIVSRTVAQATVEYINAVEKILGPLLTQARTEQDKLTTECSTRSSGEHRDILEAIHERRGVK